MGRDEVLDAFDLHGHRANLEALHLAFDAFNRGDFDAAMAKMHPDIEWHRGALMVGAETLHGVDAVRDLLEPDVFQNQEVELESIVARRSRYLATVVFSARGVGSGIELSNRGYHVWTVEDGKGRQFNFFAERDEALDFLFADPD